MQSNRRVAHVALNLLLRCQCCHGVDDDDVDGSRAYQLVGNLQGLLAVVGLRYVEVVDVDAQLLGIEAVEGVLSVDECGYAPRLLRLGNGVDGQCGLTA